MQTVQTIIYNFTIVTCLVWKCTGVESSLEKGILLPEGDFEIKGDTVAGLALGPAFSGTAVSPLLCGYSIDDVLGKSNGITKGEYLKSSCKYVLVYYLHLWWLSQDQQLFLFVFVYRHIFGSTYLCAHWLESIYVLKLFCNSLITMKVSFYSDMHVFEISDKVLTLATLSGASVLGDFSQTSEKMHVVIMLEEKNQHCSNSMLCLLLHNCMLLNGHVLVCSFTQLVTYSDLHVMTTFLVWEVAT